MAAAYAVDETMQSRKRAAGARFAVRLSSEEERRFGHELLDRADRECAGRPLDTDAELADALQRGINIMAQRTQKQRVAADMPLAPGGPKSVSAILGDMVAGLRRRARELDAARTVYTRAQLATDLLRNARCSGGDQRLEAIRRMLNRLGYTRSQSQRRFHNAFIRACLPIIVSRAQRWRGACRLSEADVRRVACMTQYGTDWEMQSERVMREMNITSIRYEVMIQTPRRFGKTVSVAMFCLSLLLCCPGIRVCIFSTGKRASSNLMTEIMDRLNHVPGGLDRILKSNQEQLFLSTVVVDRHAKGDATRHLINQSTTSRLYSFPGQ